jgi:Fe-S-cluster containining protein
MSLPPTDFDDHPLASKENLPVSAEAQRLHREAVREIRALLNNPPESPLDPAFRESWERILGIYERFQHVVLSDAGRNVCCAKGCSYCCNHWVEDVYFFEGAIIADHLRGVGGDRIAEIVRRFAEDEKELARLHAIVDVRTADQALVENLSESDRIDLLLACYYRLRRPCVFLDDDGSCGIYAIRPLSCRMYLSFSDPSYCDPDRVDESDVHTYLLDFEEEASALLDELHRHYDRFGNITGLRSLLLRFLKE